MTDEPTTPEESHENTSTGTGAAAALSKAYDDLLQPSAKRLGGVLDRTLSLVLGPLELALSAANQVKKIRFQRLFNEVAEKVKGIPDEELEPVDPVIGGPSLEHVPYIADEDDLRVLFVNLLSSSMVRGKKSLVHPTFTTVLKRLSADEGRILQYFAAGLVPSAAGPDYRLPLASIQAQFRPTPGPSPQPLQYLVSYFLRDHVAFPDSVQIETAALAGTYIANLVSLGLIDASYDILSHVDGFYDVFSDDPVYQKAMRNAVTATKNPPKGHRPGEVKLSKGLVSLTSMGESFCRVCCLGPATAGSSDAPNG